MSNKNYTIIQKVHKNYPNIDIGNVCPKYLNNLWENKKCSCAAGFDNSECSCIECWNRKIDEYDNLIEE